MAIAFDAKANSSGSGTSLTYSHTCTGSNLILIVGFQTYKAAGLGNVITGVTYNGVAMTQIGIVTRNATDEFQYMYYLVSPATGAHNIVISASSSLDLIAASSASYTGSRQSGQPDSYVTSAVTSAGSVTTTTNTIADNCWLVGFYVSDMGGGWTPGANTTARDATGNCQLFDSNAAKTPAGSYSLTATHSASMVSGQMVSISPFVASANNGNMFLAM